MSMSRSIMEELSDFVLHKPATVLGNKFFDCRAALNVDVASKSDKYEPRLLVISKFRMFLVTGKSPSSLKIERSFHILNVKGIQVVKDDEIALSVEETQTKKRYLVKTHTITSSQLVIHLLSALKHYFPDIGVQLQNQMELTPGSLYDDFMSLPLDVAARPCHSFRRTYAAMCDFYDQPYREEVSWDVEKIYTINKLHSLRIEDFSHLLPRDLLPIVGVLQYSAYFNGLIADGVRLPVDLIEVILNVVRKSHYLKELILRNCALPRDFILLFAGAIQPSSPLELIDFSKNVLDDKKGFGNFCVALPKMQALRHISFSECGLSEKCIHSLCSGLYNSLTSNKAGSSHGIKHLNLGYCTIKDEISSLVNLVSLCTSLRVLDLTDTAFPLEKLWPALKYGGLQIEKLVLSGCQAGKRPADSASTMKEYFTMAVSLNHISFSNTVLHPEHLKSLLLGLCSNQQLKPYYLNLDAACDKGSGQVLETCLSGLSCSGISLRDNNLEADMQSVVTSLCSISTLTHVDIGGANLSALKRSNKPAHASVLNRILLDIVKLYGDESPVEELILSKAQLGTHLSVLLNTLGATTSLKHFDISHNEMGNFGARILSKALQLNVSLRSINIDNNKICADGFVDIASAMQINYTLTSIPYPVNDVFDCRTRNETSRVLHSLSQIEAALERNRSSDLVETANGKKALNGGLQSLLDYGGTYAAHVDDIIANARKEVLSPKMEELVTAYVEQLRAEASSIIQESIARLGDLPVDCTSDLARAEHVAVSRLKELWLKDLRVVVSDWRWRELVERSELLLRSTATGNGSIGSSSVSGSPSISSPRVPKRSTDSSHRPRSIIGDLVRSSIDEVEEPAINLDLPPKPSELVHLQKARPKRRPGRATSTETPPKDETSELVTMTKELELEDCVDEQSSPESKEEVRKPLSERAGFRAAMLPEASLIASVQLRPSTDRLGSPRERDPPSPFIPSAPPESPPPLPPTRTRGTTPLSPPTLPPKPEPRMRTNVASNVASEDEQNANSRLSVADMTRMFNR